MITLNLNGNLGNQQVNLSNGAKGQLSGVRIFGGIPGQVQTVQWTFVPGAPELEGFVFAGSFEEGQEIKSITGLNTYKIHFI
ncbi:hypothetical protein [Lentilactobacillus senioris]|uniref:Uncharacterized protein n=1 Tax=Lentilactobacillus senioris DSM 24302 = JCM 17472 TaxID=1423802 RepID=A0A0R2CQW3_9LACO|nr:hypothetical protein [Lentilactobacillus senioris]KRM93733.1 hypothetical protein FC56_GL000451 [Lentilactobacillus senioris DSM 24302 = JCM 17472]